ncbi:MAG: DUF3616 domain-containing protein [Sedimentisphaerales bacterium]|nr:DUF3616 domain-containing protein [Sedimentisphaerales bacterium]
MKQAYCCFGLAVICAISVVRADSLYTLTGGSDPSAAAAIDPNYFVVADDEHNILKLYRADGQPGPVLNCDLSSFLRVDLKSPEADIEGAARTGSRIYWITSHARNKDGKYRASRYRFFAVDIRPAPSSAVPFDLAPAGKPCSTLLQDMLNAPSLRFLNLQSVTRFDDEEGLSKKQRERLAPKRAGFNIEGLAAGQEGKSLWIGLRNPQYRDPADGHKKAILFCLQNPDEVIDRGAAARFGEPVLLDLGGRGIRSIEYIESQQSYLIAAGAVDGAADYAFYRWDPRSKSLTPVEISVPKTFNPESIFVCPGCSMMGLISDDGSMEVVVKSPDESLDGELLPNGRCLNKNLKELGRRTFRVMFLSELGTALDMR